MNPVFPDMKALQAMAGGVSPSGKTTPDGTPEDALPSEGRGEGRAARMPAFGDLVEQAAVAGEGGGRGKGIRDGDAPDRPLARLDRNAAMRVLSAPLQSEPEAGETAPEESAVPPVIAKPERPVPDAKSAPRPVGPSDRPDPEHTPVDIAAISAPPVRTTESIRPEAAHRDGVHPSREASSDPAPRPVVEPASGVRTETTDRAVGPTRQGLDGDGDAAPRDAFAFRDEGAAWPDARPVRAEGSSDPSPVIARSTTPEPAPVDGSRPVRAKTDIRGEDGPAPDPRPSADAPVSRADMRTPAADAPISTAAAPTPSTDRMLPSAAVPPRSVEASAAAPTSPSDLTNDTVPRNSDRSVREGADVVPREATVDAAPRAAGADRQAAPADVRAAPAVADASAIPAPASEAPVAVAAETTAPTVTGTTPVATAAAMPPPNTAPRSASPGTSPAEDRPARIRDTAPADAAMAPRTSYASADRYTARTATPRERAPEPRIANREADPYSIAATMNEPVTAAEAARTLAATAGTATAPPPASSAVQATASVTATPTGALALAAQMAMPVESGDAPSKAASGGLVDGIGEAQFGLASRGTDGGADVRQAAPPMRPTTAEGADALQEIVRAAVVTKGPTTIELRLDPSELGKIDIELSFSDDRVSIMVRGEREDALDLMRRSSDELGRMLRQAGLDLDTLGFSRDQAGERGRERAFRTLAVETPGDDPGDIRDTAYSATRSGLARDRVDIRI